MNFLLLCTVGYLAGSINFSILLFKILKKDDPRNAYSQNPGATNVYRQAGLFWGVVVLILEAGKAVAIAVLALYLIDLKMVPWVGFCLIFGNRFPCFHHFKGGKGVANFLGFSSVLTPFTAVLSIVFWVVMYAVIRMPFISSFVMTLLLCTGSAVSCHYEPVAVSGTLATGLLILYSHKSNLKEFFKLLS